MIVFQRVLSIFFMILVGVIARKRKIFDENASGVLTNLVFKICLPALMIISVKDRLDLEFIKSSFVYIIIIWIVMLILFNVVYFILKKRVNEKRAVLYSSMAIFSNTVFLGFPVINVVFGEKGMPYAVIYYFANTTLVWTFLVYKFQNISNDKNKFEINISFLKKIFTAPLIGFFIGIFISILDINIIPIVEDSLLYLSKVVTPVSMIIIGILLAEIDIKKIKKDSCLLLCLFIKSIIMPYFLYLILRTLNIEAEGVKVLIMQASMPVMAQCAILAKKYNVVPDEASIGVSISTIIGLVTIPILSLLF